MGASQITCRSGFQGIALALNPPSRSLAIQALQEVELYAHGFQLHGHELHQYRPSINQLAHGNAELLVRNMVGPIVVARINTQLEASKLVRDGCTKSEMDTVVETLAKSAWPRNAKQASSEYQKLFWPIYYRHFLVRVSVKRHVYFSY